MAKLNFESPLKKARAIAARWNKCSLTLDAHILVAKTFIFSIFIHIINTVTIHIEQLDVIQKLLLDFVWKGRSIVKMSVFAAPLELGGMRMLHICNVVHTLRVKWMKWICDDRGFTWSRHLWLALTNKLPSMLLQGLHMCPESVLVCPYRCLECMNSFNNNYDLLVHMLNVHSDCLVHCKHCNYSATLKAQMRLHVRVHTRGLQCVSCGKGYPNKHALSWYESLYGKREEFACMMCSKVFATQNNLQIHVKGKHGYSYVCPCGQKFESPVQRVRHVKKCTLQF